MKKFAALLSLGLLLSVTANAQSTKDIQEIENYLNNVKTLDAHFVQTASNGGTAEGKLYISKPNKIRMEYDEPVSVLIVGDGQYVVYNDKELDQVTHIDYENIPATIILANDVKIDGKNLKVTNFYKDAGTTTVMLEHKNKEIGPITLTFKNDPLELKQWKIVDPQSVEITVSLYDAKKDVDLDKNLFKFKRDTKRKSR